MAVGHIPAGGSRVCFCTRSTQLLSDVAFMNKLLQEQDKLQQAAAAVLAETPLLSLLSKLGKPVQTGSSVTGLMVYPDIDFAVLAEERDFQKAVDLVPEIISTLGASSVKIANFATDGGESASYFVGFEFAHQGRSWQIAATVSAPGPIITNPPELADWLRAITSEERVAILTLKKELVEAQRYGSAKSKPPYTFRSVHLYEAVLVGKARSVSDIEAYFRRKS